jgi:filamentous hemagglutinin family protein
MTIVSGSAHSSQQGSTLQITTSQNAFLQWSSFNIASGETTVFQEPSATSVVFNRINSANPSSIFGSLRANGIVVLENQSGFYFGPNSFVSANGLVVTTAAINPGPAGGASWSFDGPPTAAPIVNYGNLQTAAGGSIFVIGKQIENHGTISAPGGTAALVAGQEVLLSQRPDGLSLSAPVQLPVGSVDNQGRITADAGQILLQAKTVNNSGILQANSVRQGNGTIELFASQDIQVADSSVIQANGDASAPSQGGNIVVKSGGTFSDSPGSRISATGGASGGDGGNIEVSAPTILSLNSRVDATAQAGSKEGVFMLDPQNIELGTFSSGSTSAGTTGIINATGSSGTVTVDVGSAFKNISAGIVLEASGNITLDANTTWNLSGSTGKTSGQVTLEAGGSITLNSGSSIQDANNWSLALEAGYNFSTGKVAPGTGSAQNNVTLLGNSQIQLASGNAAVQAGNNVTLGTGGIVTGIANGAAMSSGGGNVSVQALSGTVNCGSSTAGYTFNGTGNGYLVSPRLGGISTAAGGNVLIQASANVTAPLPVGTQNLASDSGSGAFGAAPGNVTVIAGGTVVGHFVLANGVGNIAAQGNAGTTITGLGLSLINGGWTVNAVGNIILQEVRNPNGMFNNAPSSNPLSFRFDYNPLDYVSLNAAGVTITGASVPRIQKSEGLIFPPTLDINAGAGGITLDATVNLFPSPEGTLNLATTAGGSFQTVGNGVTLNLSDSTRTQFSVSRSFLYNDPNQNPLLHLNDPNPVLINISGSVNNMTLDSSKPVQMNVAGDIVNSSASILNLRPTDVTTISAGGQIIQHDNFVVVNQLQPGQAPNFDALDQVATPVIVDPFGQSIPNPNLNPLLLNIENSFNYNPATRSMLYLGSLSVAQENALLAIHFLDKADLDYIQQQSLTESTASGLTYAVAGPGTLRVRAASISLGNEGGIVSQGLGGQAGLVPVTQRGADLDISASGNIEMAAASVQSQYGGAINIRSGGTIDVGSPILASIVNSEEAGGAVFGITSLWQGNINVVADGDINVDTSRIAAYDGGNVFVESLHGNVNAGNGGNGAILVTKTYVDAHGQLQNEYNFIPGSGILATSYPQLIYGETSGRIGNITIQTPEGNIEASHGGIVQLALGPAQNNATITLSAGSKNPDGSVASVGNVDASGSGVVGGQVNISATGNINGLVVASVGATVTALQNISATVLSQGNAAISAGGTVSGTIVGVGSVSVSGASDAATAFAGGGVTTGGNVTGGAVPAAPTGTSSASAAATTQQAAQSTQSNTDMAANGNSGDNDPTKKKKKTQLMQYVGRVTVLLPN